jgi:phosphatidylinositol alpha-1,6-mannosyltransferase
VSKIPDARLLLAGGGPRFDRLRNLVRQSPAQANIDLRSFVPEDEIDAIWRGATVFAMLGSDEGFGLVLIEAMRHGLPVIASTDDASREVNADGVSGFNVPRGDTGALAERIVFLLSDRDRAAGYGRAGQARWREHFRFSGFKGRLRTLLRPWLEQP